jgi:molecular chaperone HscA
VQGERETAEACRSLARFTLRGIPPMPAGLARLEVRFEVDADGLLHVSAKELTTGIEQQVEVKPSYGLSDEEVERMLLEAYDHAETDITVRALREQRVEAERIAVATRAALDQDAALLDAAERADIERKLEAVLEAARGDNHHVIASRIEELDHVSRNFAGLRMDRSIKQALAGQRLSDVERDTAHAEGIDRHLGSQKDDSE